MRRRRALIDDYLRAHDPLGAHADEVRAAASSTEPAPPDRHPRRILGLRPPALAGGSLALAAGVGAVAFAIGGLPVGGSDGPLSAEEAVAGIAADLDRDGILEWETRTRVDPDFGHRTPLTTVRWIDLKTGEEHTVSEDGAYRARGKLVDKIFRSWRTTTTDWSAREDRGTTRRIRVKEYRPGFLGTRTFGSTDSPLGQVQEALDLAERGAARLEPMPAVGGVPVVRVTAKLAMDPKDPAEYAMRLWITRERSPRVLRGDTEIRCPSGAACDPTPEDGRDSVQIMPGSDTVRWKIHGRTPEALAKVALPTDTSRYELIPRSR